MRSRLWIRIRCCAWGAALALMTTTASADPVDPAARSTARKLGQEALKLYDAGKYAAALEKLNTADSLVPTPTLGLYAARCLVKLGRLVEASERYLDVTRMQVDRQAPAVMRKAQAEAVLERDKLLPTIPTLDVRLEGPRGDGVEITVDDKPLLPGLLGEKRPVNPGDHRATVKRADAQVTGAVTVAAGGSAQIVLTLPPLPPKPEMRTPPLRIAGWVGFGLGAAGATLGAVNGLIAIAQQQSLVAECAAGRSYCPTSAAGTIAAYNVTSKLTTVGLVTGLAGLGFGIPVLVLTPNSEWVNPDGSAAPPPRAEPKVSVLPWIGPGGVGISGSF